MTIHRVVSIVFLCMSIGAYPAFAAPSQPAPLNRPAPGVKAVPNGTTGQGLGMAILGARVQNDGTLLIGAGATAAARLASGAYEIDFTRDVSTCIYSAVSFTTTSPVSAEPRAGNPNGVFIIFIDTTGAHTDSQFYITVFCNS